MTDVNLVVALVAGVLALLSPCSALLLPSFFAVAFTSPRALLSRIGVFWVGLAATLVPLGIGASAASQLFYGHRAVLIAVAGWTIIGLGVLQVLGKGFAVPGAGRVHAWVMGRDGTRWTSTLALGAAYGLAGFCSGPVLGAILTVAATREAAWQGGALLAAYALGMTVPLLVLAGLWSRFDLAGRSWLRGRTVRLGPVRTHTTSLVAGLMFIAVGAVFLRYDGTAGLTGSFGFGDTTDLEFEVQRWLGEWGGQLPAWVLPAVVFVVAGLVAWRRARSARVPDTEDASAGISSSQAAR